MGCSACHGTVEDEPERPLRPRLHVPPPSVEGVKRSLTPTKEIKLKQSNYVVVISAKLSDLYEIKEKAGEGGV